MSVADEELARVRLRRVQDVEGHANAVVDAPFNLMLVHSKTSCELFLCLISFDNDPGSRPGATKSGKRALFL